MVVLIARIWALLLRLTLLLALGLATWGLVLTCQRYLVVALLLTGFLAWWRMGRGEGLGWSFGTARYASAGEAARGGWPSSIPLSPCRRRPRGGRTRTRGKSCVPRPPPAVGRCRRSGGLAV